MIGSSLFPNLDRSVKANWAPVLLRPILGSPEQMVIAVVAANRNSYHIESANSLRRLECLFGRSSETAITAAEIALFELELSLSKKGLSALTTGQLIFSGVFVGDIQSGEGQSLQSIARTWMNALSSLQRSSELNEDKAADNEDGETSSIPDRLPILVFEHTISLRPGLKDFFSEEIRRQQQRRSRSIPKVSIDFSGSHLVANFATLRPNQRSTSIDRIKRKVFDLIVRRDDEKGSLAQREHDMIVYSPGRDDPTLSMHQVSNLEDDMAELADQSDREGIGYRTTHSVPDIGSRILVAERLQ